MVRLPVSFKALRQQVFNRAQMRVAIIGAGGAGLASAKCCQDNQIECDIFEQTDKIGGTWNYSDKTGLDDNGLPIHSSMYKNLRTNLPKEVMEMDGLSYPETIPKSYLSQKEVLDYIIAYAKLFRLEKLVKFFRHVEKVSPTEDKSGFIVETKDLKTGNVERTVYSHVIVCNGHFSEYTLPAVEGIDSFSGRIHHSHTYRVPEPFKDKTVLVVGAGPSGLNISEDIANVATQVYLSYSKPIPKFHPRITPKPNLRSIKGSRIQFTDGSEEEIQEVLFCTGYDYTFPFLDKTLGIEVWQGKYVRPLYKEIVNARNPRMAFIGMPFRVCPFPLFSLQANFFVATITGHYKLPSEEEMLKQVEAIEEHLKTAKVPLRHYHSKSTVMGEYFDDIADTAKIQRVRPVINNIYCQVLKNRNPSHRYKIIDNENFVCSEE